ncbi:MAG: DUF4260 domain-containing protein [Bacteroidetes bacterium]|nr:DUF4260 domain-containing protein [Bacteroidota bacterium]
MKNILKTEEAAMFLLSIFIFHKLDFSWWWFPVLIFTPDLSMIGYLINPKIGAWCYNIAHHKGLALMIYVLGIILPNPYLQLSGIILFGHSSMDRILGYGLKYNDRFNNTHLGVIGKSK